MTAASILEYMLITVTCCEEITKKQFKHRIQVCTVQVHIFWHLRPHCCIANSRTFQDQTHFL